jgi:hypothetical protein
MRIVRFGVSLILALASVSLQAQSPGTNHLTENSIAPWRSERNLLAGLEPDSPPPSMESSEFHSIRYYKTAKLENCKASTMVTGTSPSAVSGDGRATCSQHFLNQTTKTSSPCIAASFSLPIASG